MWVWCLCTVTGECDHRTKGGSALNLGEFNSIRLWYILLCGTKYKLVFVVDEFLFVGETAYLFLICTKLFMKCFEILLSQW